MKLLSLKNFIKRHLFLTCFILVITVLELIPAGTFTLLNAATYVPVRGFHLIIPGLRYIFEPFIGIPLYLSTNHYLKAESISLFLWGLFFVLSIPLLKNQYRKLPLYAIGYIIGFSLFVVYLLFTPFPLMKAVPKSSSYCLIDPHSHTFYSHDGLVSPGQNIRWHVRQGFTGGFVTEHYNIEGGIMEQDLSLMTSYKAMIGEEVRVKDDPHFFLALGISRSVAGWCPDCPSTVKALADAVHKQGGALVLALWWTQGPVNLGQYVKDGVDAFEIANAGHKNLLSAADRQNAYTVSQKEHIPLLASTDWHGWGNYAYTWTAFAIPEAGSYNTARLNAAIVSMLRDRNSGDTGKIIPLIYDYPHQDWGSFRYLFAPFFDFYYYFSTLPLKGYISWVVWTILLWLSYTIYRKTHLLLFPGKPWMLPYILFIAAGILSLYDAVRMIVRVPMIPAENTLLLTVLHVLLLYSISVLVLIILWMYIRTVRHPSR